MLEFKFFLALVYQDINANHAIEIHTKWRFKTIDELQHKIAEEINLEDMKELFFGKNAENLLDNLNEKNPNIYIIDTEL